MRSEAEVVTYLRNNLDAAVGDYVACVEAGADYECGAHQARGEALALIDAAKFLGLTEECGFGRAQERLVPGLTHRPYRRGNVTADMKLSVAPLTEYRYGLTPKEDLS